MYIFYKNLKIIISQYILFSISLLIHIFKIALNIQFNTRGDIMKFVPKNGEKEVISFRIPKDLLANIDKIATDNSLSRNEFMVQCLEFALENLDEKK